MLVIGHLGRAVLVRRHLGGVRRVRRLDDLVLVRRRLDGVGVADGPAAAVRRRVPGVAAAAALVPLVPARRVPPALAPDQPRAGGDG